MIPTSPGIATIYQPSEGRSRAEILATMETADVALPAYARDLFAEFDSNFDTETNDTRLEPSFASQSKPSLRARLDLAHAVVKPSMDSTFTLVSAASDAEPDMSAASPHSSKRTSGLWPGRLRHKRTSALAVLDPVQPPRHQTGGVRTRLALLFNIGEQEDAEEGVPSMTNDPTTPRSVRQRGRYDSQRSTGTVRKLRNRFSIIGKR
jgi:hypothetical protein